MSALANAPRVGCADGVGVLRFWHESSHVPHGRTSQQWAPQMSEPTGNAADHGDVTRLLSASASGSPKARDRLVEILHKELHMMAKARMRSERIDHTLGATALVNETFLRLFRRGSTASAEPSVDSAALSALPWADRRAFFANAATVMRRVLIDHARARNSEKRSPNMRRGGIRVEADAVAAAQQLDPHDFIALNQAIDALIQVDARAAQVTRLRFFTGLNTAQIAELLEVSERTVKRDWRFARIWLHDALHGDADSLVGRKDEE